MLYLGILGQELKKKQVTVIFEISTLKLVKLQNFAKNQKYLRLLKKLLYLAIFEL